MVRFYNKRGTAEQWIKEGKQAVKMTRLSCHRFRANEVRLWLSVIAYNLGNLWRRLALPKRIENWSLTSLQQRLVKTGGRLVKHARYYWLMLAESHLTRRLFGACCGGLRRCRCQPDKAACTAQQILMRKYGEAEVSAQSIGPTAFMRVAWPGDAKPTHRGAAGGTVDQNWAKPLTRVAGWSRWAVEIGEAKRKFRSRRRSRALTHTFRLTNCLVSERGCKKIKLEIPKLLDAWKI